MLLSQAYELIYTGQSLPQHVIKQISGIQNDALAIGSAGSIALAEWMLNKIEYEGKAVIRDLAGSGVDLAKVKDVAAYVKHIHSACVDEIQERFQRPMLDDAAVAHLLWDDAMSDLLDNIQDVCKKDLDGLEDKANGVLRIWCDQQNPRAFKGSAADAVKGSIGGSADPYFNVRENLRRVW